MSSAEILLHVCDLYLNFETYDGVSHVLNGVNLAVQRGAVVGLVGETGCGKSMTGLSVSRLVSTPPGHYPRGQILFDGIDVMQATEAQMRKLRGRRIGMVFQDPATNLNPVFRISEQMMDVVLNSSEADRDMGLPSRFLSPRGRRQTARRHAVDMLERVGITDASQRIDGYPHEFSGGMRQRVLIAMALLGNPELLIADEPTTALDVSVQLQILRLLEGLIRQYRLTLLLITHNLGVVAQLCDEIAVMYAGNIVERGSVWSVFKNPRHPYTQGLLRSIPTLGTKRGELLGISGNIPSFINPPPGCRFAPRCVSAMPICRVEFPASVSCEPNHHVACHLYTQL